MITRELKDFYRFFWGTSEEEKKAVFYAENQNYFPYFEDIMKRLNGVCYVASGSLYPLLNSPNAYYINKLLPFFFALVDCRVFVMTLTDLNQFYLRRSVNPVHYVYVFHSMISTHMIYRRGAFDYYDSILCTGPHQIEEIRRYERLHGLKPKLLIEAGYPRVEEIHRAHKEYHKGEEGITVLVAPTWGPTNLMKLCGNELIEILLKEGYEVILRLHPEEVKRHHIWKYSNVKLETSVVDMYSLVKADVLITDWSGIGLEYAFGTERPVIFIDTPPKIRNSEFNELGIEPIESSIRDKIGVIVSPSDLSSLPKVVSSIVTSDYRERITGIRDVFNFGYSADVSAKYIEGLL